MLYGFLISADPAASNLTALSQKYLGHTVDAEPAAQADAILSLREKLWPAVEAAGLADVYARIDLLLIRVLAEMETEGIRVDPGQLGVLSGRMEEEIGRLTGEIHELAGKSFKFATTIRQSIV